MRTGLADLAETWQLPVRAAATFDTCILQVAMRARVALLALLTDLTVAAVLALGTVDAETPVGARAAKRTGILQTPMRTA
mmetsp:Transcript_23451/g.49094  ORF Transcript_23451/g.49094 Transcript_23451/m.49094 type:complete len:80 (+) Transcript_23451:411-650(+)